MEKKMKMIYRMFLVASGLVLATSTLALAQSSKSMLAATPPMGWNSWNHFRGEVTEADIRATADYMVSSGLRDVGYVYVNIDDTWEGTRDAAGNIQSNKKFPDMKALADYVHSKGLKIGIYSSPGPKTCAGFEGSYGHEEQDAKTYATWGIDYLKYDLCSFRHIMDEKSGGDRIKSDAIMREAYQKMHLAILATGRPMIYSLCQYGIGSVWEWGPEVGANLWRTTDDISASYIRMALIGFSQAGLSPYAAPGHWNDPDMLEIGNGLSLDASQTHMTLWAMLAAPLLAGNDLSKMTPETLSILTNKEVIAIDQDTLGRQGERLTAVGPYETWVRDLSNGDKAVALFNRGESSVLFKFSTQSIGWKKATARNLWTHQELGILPDNYEVVIPRQGAVLLRLTQAK
jgi:alpha-galactosidase